MKINVDVTRRHIAKGVRGDPWFCPLALALWEQTGTAWKVESERYTLAACAPFTPRLPLPAEAEEFRKRFDSGHVVAPRRFEFEVPYTLTVITVGSSAYSDVEQTLRAILPPEGVASV